MKKQSNLISLNLSALRQYHKYSQEEVAEKIGVSRQAVAKWESGETVPDILNCDALAKLYNVSIDDHISLELSRLANVAKLSFPKRQGIFFALNLVTFWSYWEMKLRKVPELR